MRTTARETVFKVLFSSQFHEQADSNLANALYKMEKLTEADRAYCNAVLAAVQEHKEEFSAILDKHSISFPEKRIYPADRSVLLVALAEIFYIDDVPDKVTLNEAANVASKYSSAKSASFITGILSAVIGEKNNG